MTVQWSGAAPGHAALDVCCGSGDLALLLAEAVGPAGAVTGLDFSAAMLEDARRRAGAGGGGAGRAPLRWVQGDALRLPFAPASFDAATMGYGLRNVADIPLALRELHRVLKPGGTVAILDFNNAGDNFFADQLQASEEERAEERPREGGAARGDGARPGPPRRLAFYLSSIVVPAATAQGLEEEYRYLRPSIQRFPAGRQQEQLAREAGFRKAAHYAITFGQMGVLISGSGMTDPAFFSADRRVKYGRGALRLAIVLAASLFAVPALHGLPPSATAAYLRSWRWAAHAYMGIIGAAINVRALGFRANVALLLGAAAFVALDAARHGPATVAYVLKTCAGDLLAGKLDSREWRLALAVVPAGLAAGAAAAAAALGRAGAVALAARHARVLAALTAVQAACEWGDARWEAVPFFRHRRSFELATLALLAFLPRLAPHELLIIQIDLVACTFYRLANYALCLAAGAGGGGAGAAVAGTGASTAVSRALLAACFRLHFWRRRARLARVRDPELARAVLLQSADKGAGLERYIACPAWAPVLSLESVDGQLWREMRADLGRVMRALPPPAALGRVADAALRALAASGRDVDAAAVARFAAECFIRYTADPAVKAAAVARLTDDLLPRCPALWALFGDAWRQPRHYSLVLQPLLISPCINIGDIAVAMAAHPELAPEAAMRLAHPFPILERYVARDVLASDGRVAIPGDTHAIMFTADFAGSPGVAWPVFGAGPRACAGAALMQPLLAAVHAAVAGGRLPRFRPADGHRWSGRNNDGSWTLAESWYFVRTVGPLLLFPPRD
eukprot:scaffold16.g67.t1